MPWCETCSRFLNPNSLVSDGTCPSCGRQVGEPQDGAATEGSAEVAGAPGSPGAETVEQPIKAPWHFKLLVAATVIYLAWRTIQMAGWVIG